MREDQQARTRSESRRRLFLVLTIALPIAFFFCVESGLRLVGYGGDYPLFVEAEDLPGYLVANDQVIHRYYAAAPELSIVGIHFQREKPANGYRIVVQGASTAAGFPYGRWGGLAGMLGHRLEMTYPDREIEVITTALAAVNSYTLLDFVDEIIEIEPDAVLIYAGHNEFVGILGVGSGLSASGSRPLVLLQLELRKLRCFQLLEEVIRTGSGYIRGLVAANGSKQDSSRGTLLSDAASSASAPYGSVLYQKGAEQWEANLGAILQKYREAGIDVYIGTVASNEKDQKPFSGLVSDRVDRAQWDLDWRAFRAAAETSDVELARSSLLLLLEQDRDAAEVWYALGQLELDEGHIEAARDAFRSAKDRDALRFRAPEIFNQIIRDLARDFDAQLVDVQEHLGEIAPHGILGDDLFLEHVHPNDRGYFFLADAYYRALEMHGPLGAWEKDPTRTHPLKDMPITILDRIHADLSVLELKSTYPFQVSEHPVRIPEPKSEIERTAQELHRGEIGWLQAMENLMQFLRKAGRLERAAVVARMAATTYPSESAPNYTAGVLLEETEHFVLARKYLSRSLRSSPNSVATLAALVSTNLALGDAQQADGYYERLRRIAPTHPAVAAHAVLGRKPPE